MVSGLVTSFLVYLKAFCFSKWKTVVCFKVLGLKKASQLGQKLADTENDCTYWEQLNMVDGLVTSFLLFWQPFCSFEWKRWSVLGNWVKRKLPSWFKSLLIPKNPCVHWELEICTALRGCWPFFQLSGLLASFLFFQMKEVFCSKDLGWKKASKLIQKLADTKKPFLIFLRVLHGFRPCYKLSAELTSFQLC